MKLVIKSVSVLILSSVVFFSCSKDKVDIDALGGNSNCLDTVSYASQIEPILNQSCATSGCHAGGAGTNGYDLTNHSSVSANANIILSVIRHDGGVTAMPYGGAQLADSVGQNIECWISQGKLNN